MKKKNLCESASKLAMQLPGLVRQAGQACTQEVDAVIFEKSRDTKRIENLLNDLLNFAFEPSVLILYKKK